MTRLRAFVAVTVGALSFSAAAYAADAPGSWSPPDFGNSPAPLTEFRSGWYVRGDLSYRLNRIGSVDSTAPIVSQTYDNVITGGGGFGYKYQFLRADLTLDYASPTKFQATTANPVGQPQFSASIQPITALANAYFDLGTWYGVTPYAGAGVGGSYMRVVDYQDNALPLAYAQSKGTRYTWSWAWMAGLSYRVSQHWAIDAGYRQLSLGDAIGGPDANGVQTKWRNLTAQEFRVGFRFLID